MTPEEKREKKRIYMREWHAANREEQSAKMKSYNDAHKEEAKTRKAGRIDAYRQTQRAWYKLNASRLLDEQRSRRARDVDKYRSRQRARRAANLESVRLRDREMQHKRRTKKRGALSAGRIQTLMLLQKGKCANCHCSIRARFHIDHIVPIALGGEHRDGNVQLLCPLCNHKKHAKDPIQFAQEQGRLL